MKYLTARPGDADLDKPPCEVVISLMGLMGGKHWSTAIVEDRRPLPARVVADDGFGDGGTPYTDEEMAIIDREDRHLHRGDTI